MTEHIPDLITVQKQLLTQILTAGAKCGVKPVLHQYRSSPRMALRVETQGEAVQLLAACTDEGILISDPNTHAHITVSDLKTTKRSALRLWTAIVVDGRMIHGSPSGIDLSIQDSIAPCAEITFPHPAFADLWLNHHLAGQQMSVDQWLIRQRMTSQQPKNIDVVLTWVDDQDAAWQARRARFSPVMPTSDSTDAARFTNNNELLYALRGLFRYFDGIGRVYLVTDQQTPDFWEEFKDRITLVDHRQIMAENVARPTFNSHVIESCLHKIPGLADQYVYLNDDVILINATGVSDFFDDKGRAKVFYSLKKVIPDGPLRPDMLAADAAAINARELFARRFDHQISRKFQHGPIAINRDVIETLERLFSRQFSELRQARFRSQHDLAPSGSLYQHYALMTDRAVPASLTYRYLQVTDYKIAPQMLRLGIVQADKRPTVICLNAVTGGAGSRWNRFWIRWQMQCLLPPPQASQRPGHLRRIIFDYGLVWIANLRSSKNRGQPPDQPHKH